MPPKRPPRRAKPSRARRQPRRRPVRAPLPAHLPRERVVIPAPSVCPCCQGKLVKLGEDVTETLEVIPRQWKVIQTVREKFTCRSCEKIAQPPAPFHPIARGRAGAGLLAMVLFGKYGTSPAAQPAERGLRPRGHRSRRLDAGRLGRRLCRGAVAAGRADPPPRAECAAHPRRRHDGAGAGQGQDQSPAGCGPTFATTGRSADRIRRRRSTSTPAIATASIRAGTSPITAAFSRPTPTPGSTRSTIRRRKPGPITEAACWSHARRKFFVLADVAKAPLALEAVRRIDALFDVERALNGVPEDQRLALRQEHAAPLVGELEAWMRRERARLSRHNERRQGDGLPAEALARLHPLPRRRRRSA